MELTQVFKQYRGSLFFVLFLILVDAGLSVLFPLFIGFAIDDVMVRQYKGVWLLGALGLSTLLIGAGQRFVDSRVYAEIYQDLGGKLGTRSGTETSTRSAHLGFLSELVEFFEHTVPEILNALVALVGTLLLIYTMDVEIFLGCLIILVVVAFIYGISQKRTIRFHAGYNQEMEKRVEVLSGHNPIALKWHLKKVMKWNVKLSDLETINFSVVWLILIGFLVFSIVGTAGEANLSHGALFALVLYLFQFIEQVVALPLFYQQALRLSEILKRLRTGTEVAQNTVNHG